MNDLTLFNWSTAPDDSEEARSIEVLGVPTDRGNSIAAGARLAPAAIRRASLTFGGIAGAGIDLGDVVGVHHYDADDVLKRVEQAIATIYQRGSIALILGGDHSVSFAAIAAARAPLNVLWFDAHTDFCTWSDGDWHDHKQVLRRVATLDHVGQIVQLGHRGLTYVDEARHYDRLTVIGSEVALAMNPDALLALLPASEPVYISIDIDVIDPFLAPGTGHPVPGGLSLEHVTKLADAVVRARRIVGVDFVEVNPLLDEDDATSRAAARIAAALVPSLAAQLERRQAEMPPRMTSAG